MNQICNSYTTTCIEKMLMLGFPFTLLPVWIYEFFHPSLSHSLSPQSLSPGPSPHSQQILYIFFFCQIKHNPTQRYLRHDHCHWRAAAEVQGRQTLAPSGHAWSLDSLSNMNLFGPTQTQILHGLFRSSSEFQIQEVFCLFKMGLITFASYMKNLGRGKSCYCCWHCH